jgi:hypothetical protein
MLGIAIWGPYDGDKTVICQTEEYVHFLFSGENRLVKLGCDIEEEYPWLGAEDEYFDDDDISEPISFDHDDDEEDFPNGSLDY